MPRETINFHKVKFGRKTGIFRTYSSRHDIYLPTPNTIYNNG